MNGAAAWLAFVVLLGVGGALAWLRWGPTSGAIERLVWSAGLAPALGLGFGSLLLVAWRALFGSPPGLVAGATTALLLLGAARYAPRSRTEPPASLPLSWRRIDVALLAATATITLVTAVRAAVAYWSEIPEGAYDAVATWNLRARLLFLAPGELGEALSATNYPLLLPGAIALQWSLADGLSAVAPRATGLAFLFAVPLLLVAAARERRAGLAAAAFFLATPFAVGQGASQEADVPTACLLLAAAGLLAASLRDGATQGGPSTELAGLALGFLSWTKNEGLLWASLLLAVAAVTAPRKLQRRGIRLLLGAAPGAVALVLFKALWAPASGLSASTFLGEGALGRLLDLERWGTILRALGGRLDPTAGAFPWGLSWLLLLAAAALLPWLGARSADEGTRLLGRLAIGCLAILPVVYALTPLPLGWHLETSLDRLLLQIYPLTLLAAAEAVAARLVARQSAAARIESGVP